MRKEERKEKRPRKNVSPSPPNHYQPINYSSPPVSPPSPPYPISSCAATRPLLPSWPPQTEHQRRQSSSLPRPPPDGAPAPSLQEGALAGRQRRSRAPPPRIPGAGGLHPLSWGPDLAGAGAVEDEEGGGRAPASSGNLLAPPFISQSLLPLALPLFVLGVGDALASLSALTPWRRLGDA